MPPIFAATTPLPRACRVHVYADRMALSTDQLAYLRSELGTNTPPTDADLEAAFGRLGTLEAVAAEIVRTRLATMLSNPTSFSVEGYSQSYGANIDALTKQAARLEWEAGAAAGETIVERLVRTSPSR